MIVSSLFEPCSGGPLLDTQERMRIGELQRRARSKHFNVEGVSPGSVGEVFGGG